MRNLFVLLGFFAVLIITAVIAQEQPPPEASAEDIADEDVSAFDLESIIVRPKANGASPPSTPPLKAEEAEMLGLRPQPEINAVGSFIYRTGFQIDSLRPDREKLKKLLLILKDLRRRKEIEYAELNPIEYPQETSEEANYRKMWHYHDYGSDVEGASSQGGVSLPQAWRYGKGSSNVTVAVLDTGFLLNHPDITTSSNVGAGYDFVSRSLYANDTDGRDDNPTDPGDGRTAGFCADAGLGSEAREDSWHGLHVAGIIGIGRSNNEIGIAGVNAAVRVLPVRIGGKCGAHLDDVIAAIKWAAGRNVKGAPANKFPARIINLSFGRKLTKFEKGCHPDKQKAIDEAVKAGAIIVVAAGNDADEAEKTTNASCKNVVVVAASNAQGHIWPQSNFGGKVDLMAPGEKVWSYVRPTPENPDGVAEKSGASMAAAHVSGVLALMLAQNPKLSNNELVSILKGTAISRSTEQCPKGCGAGLLDAGTAVAQAAQTKPAKPAPAPPAAPPAPAPPAAKPAPAQDHKPPSSPPQTSESRPSEPRQAAEPRGATSNQARRRARVAAPPRPRLARGFDCACPCHAPSPPPCDCYSCYEDCYRDRYPDYYICDDYDPLCN